MSGSQRGGSGEQDMQRALSATPPSLVQHTGASASVRASNRVIAPNSRAEEPESRDAIQKYIEDGLAKVPRRSNDPNRINIVVPQGFLHMKRGTTDQTDLPQSPTVLVERPHETSKATHCVEHK